MPNFTNSTKRTMTPAQLAQARVSLDLLEDSIKHLDEPSQAAIAQLRATLYSVVNQTGPLGELAILATSLEISLHHG